jgi:hypothetical protein
MATSQLGAMDYVIYAIAAAFVAYLLWEGLRELPKEMPGE